MAAVPNIGIALRVLSLVLALFSLPARADMTIVILRHGEKPAQGLGQLDCQGLNRALALAPLLLSRYGRPDGIYAPNPAVRKKDKGIAYDYVRPLATIEPLAIAAARPVTLAGGMEEIEALVRTVLAHKRGTQVIAWEHHWAVTLAGQFLSALGGDPKQVPRWADDDFDSLYVISVEDQAAGAPHVQFSHQHANLNGQPSSCPRFSSDNMPDQSNPSP